MIFKSILPGLLFSLASAVLLHDEAYCQSDSLTAKQEAVSETPGRPDLYHIKKNVDYPVTVAAAAWTLYGLSQVSKKGASDVTKVLNLKRSGVPWFDRWGIKTYSKSADKASYIPFYVAMPLPVLAFALDKRTRKDYGKLVFLYAEAMTMTGVLYSSATHYVDRYRPLVYSAESPMNTRLSGNSRNAFFAGHVALVGTSFFLVAKVFADYHPESKYKWAFYSGAAAVTLLTGYLRHEAGEHFPSDILLGTAVGTASGLLIPSLHKIRLIHNPHLSILPFNAAPLNGSAANALASGKGLKTAGGFGMTKGFSTIYRF
ncbi:MAG: phosphatase PAP2 family protein [Puia sp.]|nr:phosphatase PAP2 family protein [Puia sp.]